MGVYSCVCVGLWGEHGVGRRAAEGRARSGEGGGRAGGARGGEGDVVVGWNDEEGGEGCGACGGCGVCEGEACDTEMGGFLSLHMSDRSVNCCHAVLFAAA